MAGEHDSRRTVTMKSMRTATHLITALLVGMGPLGLVGCGDTSETKTKVEQSSPTGTTTEETTNKVKETGSNPPPPTGATNEAAPK
jgi:hypothetical protein